MKVRVYQCKLCGWRSSDFGSLGGQYAIGNNEAALKEVDNHFHEGHPDILHPWGSGRGSECYVTLEFVEVI
jgi:hypothetical protein